LTVSDDEFIQSIEFYKPDGIMLLGIVPGVLVQEHKPNEVIRKLELLNHHNFNFIKHIMIDGGVNFKTVPIYAAMGCTDLVCGSSTIYHNVDFKNSHLKKELLSKNIQLLRELIEHV